MQVPADQVIAILTQELGDMHRENAILKVQVSMLNTRLDSAERQSAPEPTAPEVPSSISSLPSFPDTTPVPNLDER